MLTAAANAGHVAPPRAAWMIGILAGFLFVGGIAVFGLLQPAWMAAELAEMAKARTGKTLTFSGAPSLSLWPETAASFPEVSLGDGQSRLLMIGELRLTTSVSALLRRRIEVSRIELSEPHLDLSISGSGQPNWELPDIDGPALRFTFSGGSIAYLDERETGERFKTFCERKPDEALIAIATGRPLAEVMAEQQKHSTRRERTHD